MLDEPTNNDIVASVATNPLKEPLSYLVPQELASTLTVGCCVKVPLGSRSAIGYVIELKKKHEIELNFKIKTLTAVIKDYPFFAAEQLKWFSWIANYYSTNLATVLETAIPAVAAESQIELIVNFTKPEKLPRGLKAREIIEFLSSQPLPYPLKNLSKKFAGSSQAIKNFKAHNIIKTEFVESPEDPVALSTSENLKLTKHQAIAASHISSCIEENEFKTFLLHGVTGSGKTEVYIQAAQKALAAGRGVLILVPEISLTPQLIERFSSRLNQPIAILHSAVHKNKRWQAWKNLSLGKNLVCLGARSAIFAPIKNLGLIIVDEEHDGSYKQNEGFRYHGRDIAVMRGKFANCPVVLGSATPSLETLLNANSKRYQYLSLPHRPFERSQASLEIIDLNKISLKKMPSKTISPALHQALSENLAKGEQSFLLYNRRGFASYLQCQVCSEAAYCPNCSVTFTYHSAKNSLVCHYCGLSQIVPKYCSKCPMPSGETAPDNIPLMIDRGAGTEKAAEEVQQLFPEARVERLDRDTVSSTEELVEILNKVKSNECQILVGTQMIAKGHDIPNVTLVGVLDCDVGLHMPDFRASERVFNLITQVAGRAGRGTLQGRVLLQTRRPKDPVLQYAVKDHYLGFAEHELLKRQELNYPPFGKLLRIVISDADLSIAKNASETIAAVLMKESHRFNNPVCLGPAACPIERLRGLYRFHILLKNPSSMALSQLTKYLKEVYEKLSRGSYRNLRVTFDMDPLEML